MSNLILEKMLNGMVANMPGEYFEEFIILLIRLYHYLFG